jgi:hypothetical protein
LQPESVSEPGQVIENSDDVRDFQQGFVAETQLA